MKNKTNFVLKSAVVSFLACSLLSGCAFMDDDAPPRYNSISGKRHKPLLNPGGTGMPQVAAKIGARANAVAMPHPDAGGIVMPGQRSAQTVNIPPAGAPVAMVHPMSAPKALEKKRLTMSDLKSPKTAEFIDAETRRALAGQDMVSIESQQPQVSVDNRDYIPLADVPPAPQGMQRGMENSQRGMQELQREAVSSRNAASSVERGENVVGEGMPWIEGGLREPAFDAGVATETIAPVTAAPVAALAVPQTPVQPAQPAVKITRPAMQASAPAPSAVQMSANDGYWSLDDIDRRFGGQGVESNLTSVPEEVLADIPAESIQPIATENVQMSAPNVAVPLPKPEIVQPKAPKFRDALSNTVPEVKMVQPQVKPIVVPISPEPMAVFPESLASAPPAVVEAAPSGNYKMTSVGEWSAPTVSAAAPVAPVVSEPLIISEPQEVMVEAPAEAYAQEAITLTAPEEEGYRTRSSGNSSLMQESRYSKRYRNRRLRARRMQQALNSSK